jgi:hypothetical protein
MTLPTVRIAVDWDDDFFICYDALPTDALNLVPSALHHTYVSSTISALGSTVTRVNSFTAYGVAYYRCVTGTNVQGGMRFGDDGGTIDEIAVSPSTTYRFSAWVRGISGYAAIPMTARVTDEDGTALGNTSFTLTANWAQVTVNVTTAVGSAFIRLTIRKDTNATNLTFDSAGFMLVAGTSAPAGFNVGDSSNGYDVITEDVRSANWVIGKSNWRDTIPAEGTVALIVNNFDRKYSPEYSLSALYGRMEQKRLITIDVKKPSTSAWVRKFAGWTRHYLPTYGQNFDNTATISCQQGVFRLREIRYRKKVEGTATADEIIQSVLFDGYVFANTPLQCLLDNARLNANSYLIDPDAVMTLDTGISEIDLNGEAWGDKDTAANVIEQLMRVERGWFFIQGDGRVRFYNRYHFTDPAVAPSPVAFTIDTVAVNGEYRHSEAFYNIIQMTHYPFTLEEGAVAYLLRERVGLGANRSKEIKVRFEREEGKRFEVESVNPFDGSVNGSTLTAVTKAGVDQSAKVKADFSQTDGRSGTLTIKNSGGASRRVTYLALKGTVRESFGGQMVEVVSANGTQGGAYILQENSKLVVTEVEAENLARYLLYMHETARGEFDSINLMNRSDVILEQAIDNGLGTRITVSEYQTAHSGDYLIVGEKYEWRPGTLRTTFVLESLDRRPDVWICGQSALGVDTYLAY